MSFETYITVSIFIGILFIAQALLALIVKMWALTFDYADRQSRSMFHTMSLKVWLFPISLLSEKFCKKHLYEIREFSSFLFYFVMATAWPLMLPLLVVGMVFVVLAKGMRIVFDATKEIRTLRTDLNVHIKDRSAHSK